MKIYRHYCFCNENGLMQVTRDKKNDFYLQFQLVLLLFDELQERCYGGERTIENDKVFQGFFSFSMEAYFGIKK